MQQLAHGLESVRRGQRPRGRGVAVRPEQGRAAVEELLEQPRSQSATAGIRIDDELGLAPLESLGDRNESGGILPDGDEFPIAEPVVDERLVGERRCAIRLAGPEGQRRDPVGNPSRRTLRVLLRIQSR
ncbi:MAG: hypothetical protein WDM88_02925 [Galbitalea sp.]